MRFTAWPLAVLLAIAGCLHGGSGLVDTSDGGSDSGVPDAGVLDAGPFDAGVPDSGIADSGPVDSGIPDAGLVDAGPRCAPDASASFGTPTVLTVPDLVWALVAADFNHDGIEDLLTLGRNVVWNGGGSINLYYGLSDGGLVPGPSLGAAYYVWGAAVGDLNGDGWTDFAADYNPQGYAGENAGLEIDINLCDGSFGRTTIDTVAFGDTSSIYQVVIADMDSDGRPDLIACTSNGIAIYFDDGGAPSFGPPALVSSTAWTDGGKSADFCESIAVVDLDGDGTPDLASFEGGPVVGTPEYLVLRFGVGDGGFSRSTSELIYTTSVYSTPFIQAVQIGAADVNGDGLPDLVWSNLTGIAVRLNLGGGRFGTEVDVATDPATQWSGSFFGLSLALVDLNGDGLPDVATSGGPDCDWDAGGGAWVFLNDGCGGFALGMPLATDSSRVINDVVAWRPAGAQLPSLVVGDLCDGNLSIFPNLTPDAG